jgi:hypothetical protein
VVELSVQNPLGRYRDAIFFASGFAGLIYESIWTHYLRLFLGHAAYAQTLVLAIFMGGMAIGAALTARYTTRIASPLRTYALVEAAIGVLALLFHPIFTATTGGFYDVAFTAHWDGARVHSDQVEPGRFIDSAAVHPPRFNLSIVRVGRYAERAGKGRTIDCDALFREQHRRRGRGVDIGIFAHSIDRALWNDCNCRRGELCHRECCDRIVEARAETRRARATIRRSGQK